MNTEKSITGKAKGGAARAESLSPERRKEIAMKGVEARKERANLPKATHFGELAIGDNIIRCFVLDDGRRVLSGRGLTNAIGMKGRGQGVARISSNKLINQSENKDLILAIENPIKFIGKSPKGIEVASDGFEATVLQEICEAMLSARDKGLITTEHDKRYATQAEILIRGFARVGIIALVDEATGYEKARVAGSLAKILEAFIAKELQPWVKTFPPEYYEELFRLYNLPYPPVGNKSWRPSFIGKITNDVIYSRLAPDILPELKKAASKAEKKSKLHQWLTTDIGHPKLREHLSSIVTILKLSKNPQEFKDNVDRVHTRYGDTNQIPFDFPNED
jgi:hypothetical protein